MDLLSAEHVLAEMQELLSNMQQEIALAMEEKKRQEAEAALAAAQKQVKELQKQELAKAHIPDPMKHMGKKPPQDGGFACTYPMYFISAHEYCWSRIRTH